jgi:heme/copper-type cytochrome/quinol oxidase subunit 3
MATPDTQSAAVTIRRQSGNSAVLGAIFIAAAGVMFMAALCGAYISVRNFIGGQGGFVPAEMKFDNYAGLMTMMSALGASASAEWALVSARLKQRRWTLGGYGFAMVLGLGAANATWFIGSRSGLVANETPYAILFYAIVATTLAMVMLGVLASLMGLIRSMGGHILGDDTLLGRASNIIVHLGTASAMTLFFLLFTYK